MHQEHLKIFEILLLLEKYLGTNFGEIPMRGLFPVNVICNKLNAFSWREANTTIVGQVESLNPTL